MNTVDRTYQVRGKEVHLQEVEDLVAVRSGSTKRLAAEADSSLDSISPQAVLPQVRAFEDAGWKFVPRQQNTEGSRVYLKKSGRVVLGTDRLTVQIDNAYSAAGAEEFLARSGFQITEHLKLAPNLFVVQVPDGEDPLEAARRLSKSKEVSFAEPQLIEVISGRDG